METKQIKQSLERVSRVLRERPAAAKGTSTTTVRVRDGLTCDIEEGPWKLTIDMPRNVGGNAEGPTPGTLGRGALGGCLLVSCMMRAAALDIPIESLEVEIQADYDDRALVGAAAPAEAPPGYSEIRYIVRVRSSAPEADVLRILDDGGERSPYQGVFAHPQKLRREVHILPAEKSAP